MRIPGGASLEQGGAYSAGRCGSRAVPVTRPGPNARPQQQSQRTFPPWQYLLYSQGVPPERAIFPGCSRTPHSARPGRRTNRSQDKAARMWPAPKIMRATPTPAGSLSPPPCLTCGTGRGHDGAALRSISSPTTQLVPGQARRPEALWDAGGSVRRVPPARACTEVGAGGAAPQEASPWVWLS